MSSKSPHLILACLLVLAMLGVTCHLEAAEPEETEEEWDEHVSVTARIKETTTAPIGASSNLIDAETDLARHGNISDLIAEVPGVAQNGQGGAFQTFSIRGVSRQRVLSLIDGMRITSERRAGVSTSFVDPLLLGSVEVTRGPATTFYGSGALGGVLQLVPRKFSQQTATLGAAENGDSNVLGVGLGSDNWSLGIVRRRNGMETAGDGSPLNTGFERTSATFMRNWSAGGRRYELLLLPTLGKNIGKSSADVQSRETIYPLERHQLAKLTVAFTNQRQLGVFVHHQDLGTRVTNYQAGTVTNVQNESFDFGLNFEDRLPLTPALSIHFGADLFARRGIQSEERGSALTPLARGASLPTISLDDAAATELGAFGALGWRWGKLDWEAGMRTAWHERQNSGEPTSEDTAVSGFVGVLREVGDHLRLGGNLSTGLRFPSVTELFYSGTTGRGDVIGNPDLDAERSLSAEVSMRWLSRRVIFTTALFHTTIDDYIERIEIGDDLLSYVNLGDGTIEGLEVQAQVNLDKHWTATLGGHTMQGTDDDDNSLADIPADELFVGFDHRRGRLWVECRLAHRFEKSDIRSAVEQVIGSADLLSGALHIDLSERFQLSVKGSNLLDERYFSTADDKAALATGRSVGLTLHWRGAPASP